VICMKHRILTSHPKGKKGRNIEKVKYEDVREHLMKCLKSRPLTFTQMAKCVEKKAKGFSGSIPWYTESIKLDLEAGEIIERVPGKQDKYRLKRKKAIA